MGKPSAPTPPDPTQVAQAQTQSNQQTAETQSQLNNGNSYGPYGSVTNVQNPGTNQWTQTTTLSPAEQNLFNLSTQAEGGALGIANDQLGRVGSALGTGLTQPNLATTLPGAGSIASGYGAGGGIDYGFNPGQQVQGQVGSQNINQSVGNAELANFAGQMQLLQPQMQQAAEQQNANLIAQGLNPNDAAWQNSQTLFGNQQATLLGQTAANAVAAGNAEQNTLYGQQLASGQFANQAAGQQYAQNEGQAAFGNTAQAQANAQNLAAAQFGNTAQAQQYGENLSTGQFGNQAEQQAFQNQAYGQELPINEFDALLGSGQVQAPSAAQLSSTGVAPTDVLGAYALSQQQQNANYQAQMQQYNSGLGGLFNLGSAALMAFSDERLKEDIEPVGEWQGLPLYDYRYKGDDELSRGVLAQDVARLRPDAVHETPSGYLAVDYGRLGGLYDLGRLAA